MTSEVVQVRVRRSFLISPAHKEGLIRKLATSAADVCILELEDGVHPSMKGEARQSAARLLVELEWGGRERLVRINRVTSDDGAADIACLAKATPDGLLLPKVEDAGEIHLASELLSIAEREAGVAEGTIQLWSMIESAKGLCQIEDICSADPRMTGVVFGAGDYGADIKVKRLSIGAFRRFPAPSHEYLYARGRVVAAARAAGIDPIDVSHSTFGDLEGTLRSSEISAQMGFTGAALFSPRQAPVVNEAFSPASEDLVWATEIVTLFEAEGAKAEAGTVVVVDGDMVDGPFVVNARDILDRQKRIDELEKRKSSTSPTAE
jgi:citrate lyase subunit beta / citryl-CoA lyase